MNQFITILATATIASTVTYFITNPSSDPSENTTAPLPAKTRKIEAHKPGTPHPVAEKPTHTPSPPQPRKPQKKVLKSPVAEISDELWASGNAHALDKLKRVETEIKSGKKAHEVREEYQRTIDQFVHQYNLNPQQAEAATKLLKEHLEKQIERDTKIITTLAESEDSEQFITQLAANFLIEPVPAEYRKQIEEEKKRRLGDLYDSGMDTSDFRLGRGLIQINPPSPWYSDNELMLELATTLGTEKGSEIIDAARKVEYHNKYAVAHRRADLTGKNLNLSADATAALTDLYLNSPKPTEEQLSKILSPRQVNNYLGRPNPK